ncbi:putative methyltransferase protein [Roseibium aggregatum IAM 12614]|uniref:Putative methyltransferase protein n=1 Tax=Roseibium aggregatum (strain ATCC 25650 / DSM 13394 / JCM 20685 / NBRC 16684 / NCIMB 2208 / IAM 12614 / B1) TaxID=384765 RepID=A0NR05_ROSAI|nr:methyltransferase [Roseibium aggregatum]EAV44586.1 putative methyltransferase protein [Roseibium aggregatum IAM 12614]
MSNNDTPEFEPDEDLDDAPENEALAEAYNRGLALQKSGDLEGAALAFREALALDPDDPGGVSIRLAAIGAEAAPQKMPDAYVATLFDQHADVFDDILVDELGYCVPLLVRDLVQKLEIGPFDRLLDLGCGTGLTGMALADCTSHRTGVDLSERIVELAYDREVYDDLYVGEAVAFLEEFEEDDGSRPSWDMIAATDVFPYLGAVEPFLAGAIDRLTPGGYLAFSTETLPEQVLQGRSYMVGPKSRFAQGEDYIRTSLDTAGFDILAMDPITVRLEEGDPVPGHLVIARLR